MAVPTLAAAVVRVYLHGAGMFPRASRTTHASSAARAAGAGTGAMPRRRGLSVGIRNAAGVLQPLLETSRTVRMAKMQEQAPLRPLMASACPLGAVGCRTHSKRTPAVAVPKAAHVATGATARRPAPRSGIRSAVAAIRRRTSAVETAPTAQFRSGASSCLSPSRRIHAEGAARAARARTGAAARHGFPRPGTLSAAAAARQCGTVQMMTRPMLPTAPMQPMSLHGVSGCQKRSRRMLVVAAPRAAHARAGVPTRLPFPRSGIPSAAAVVQEEAPEGMQTSNLAISQVPAAWCFAASPLGFTCSPRSSCP
mmetsp:Transcript_83186/g.239090  ORF Transcript_83186/g.239090 Transcript_83186/m.239090 type:complete len:310 (+) Transcript_83186:566-1495(+)